jgi:hypothetical protein
VRRRGKDETPTSVFVWLSSFCLGALGASCSGGNPQPAPSWHVVLTALQPTLLSVWGTAPNDVFAVGGPLGNGTPSVILHYDGARWTDLAAGGTETFWWTYGTGAKDVWAVGERGRITHFDGAKLTDATPRMTTATLYGVWAAAPDDVWAVGGTPDAGTSGPNDVVLHFDGSVWTAGAGPQALGRAFFKVWGTAADDLYVVGEAGTVWHRHGGEWTLESNPPLATGTLLTVNGCGSDDVYAVGNEDVLHSDGTAWTRVGVTLTNSVNGVACATPGNVVIVGSGGLKQRLADGQWHDDFMDEPHTDLHGAWADPTGAYWAAGGDFVTCPAPGASRGGILAYFGPSPPSGTLAH